MSRMTVVVDVDQHPLEQVTKQLNKLINVIKIVELTRNLPYSVTTSWSRYVPITTTRSQVTQVADLFRASVVDVSTDSIVVEVTGDPGKIAAILRAFEPFGIREIVQSGMLAIGRGSKSITERIQRG